MSQRSQSTERPHVRRSLELASVRSHGSSASVSTTTSCKTTADSGRRRRSTTAELQRSLRQYRTGLARSRRVPAYQIFHNSTLDSICDKLPRTINELRACHGIGDTRAADFGPTIVRMVKGFVASHPELRRKEQVKKAEPLHSPLGNQSDFKLKRALQALRSTLQREHGFSEPWFVFPNATVEDIAKKRPQTINDLLNCHGIGPKKASDYGESILRVVAMHARPTASPTRPRSARTVAVVTPLEVRAEVAVVSRTAARTHSSATSQAVPVVRSVARSRRSAPLRVSPVRLDDDEVVAETTKTAADIVQEKFRKAKADGLVLDVDP